MYSYIRLLQVFISNMKFDVEFTINRYPLRLQHRAVDLAAKHQLEEVLFPSGAAAAVLSMPKLRSGGSPHKQQVHGTEHSDVFYTDPHS